MKTTVSYLTMKRGVKIPCWHPTVEIYQTALMMGMTTLNMTDYSETENSDIGEADHMRPKMNHSFQCLYATRPAQVKKYTAGDISCSTLENGPCFCICNQ